MTIPIPGQTQPITLAFVVAAQMLAAHGMPELAQGLGLDLANALTRDVKELADLFQSMVGLLTQAEALAQHLLLARGEVGKHLADLLAELGVDQIGRASCRERV